MARCTLLLALLAAACLLAGAQAFKFMPEGQEEMLKTEGGRVSRWKPDGPLECAGAGAGIVELNPGGLMLPKYSNEPHLVYVVEGCACAGLVSPLLGRTNLRKLRVGDVVAIPQGWPFWAYNDGNEKFRMVGVAERTATRLPELINHTSFFLLGEQKGEVHGGILNGFSPDVLARAWGVDEGLAKKVIESQRGAGIVKLEKKNFVPPPPSENTALGEVVYNLKETQPEVHNRGGCLNYVNCYKLPILAKIGLAAKIVKLEKGAMEAPGWLTNADAIIYVIKGKGRVNIVGPGGKNEADKEIKEGDLFVTPRHFPKAILASENDCIEFVAFFTCSNPLPQFLVGRTSVFRHVPQEVFKEVTELDDETRKKLKESCQERERYEIILPPHEQKGEFAFEERLEEFEREFMRGFVDFVDDM